LKKPFLSWNIWKCNILNFFVCILTQSSVLSQAKIIKNTQNTKKEDRIILLTTFLVENQLFPENHDSLLDLINHYEKRLLTKQEFLSDSWRIEIYEITNVVV